MARPIFPDSCCVDEHYHIKMSLSHLSAPSKIPLYDPFFFASLLNFHCHLKFGTRKYCHIYSLHFQLNAQHYLSLILIVCGCSLKITTRVGKQATRSTNLSRTKTAIGDVLYPCSNSLVIVPI